MIDKQKKHLNDSRIIFNIHTMQTYETQNYFPSYKKPNPMYISVLNQTTKRLSS